MTVNQYIILNTTQSFQLFVQNVIYFLFMKLTHIQVFKNRMHEARIKCFLLASRLSVLSFDVLYVQIFI